MSELRWDRVRALRRWWAFKTFGSLPLLGEHYALWGREG